MRTAKLVVWLQRHEATPGLAKVTLQPSPDQLLVGLCLEEANPQSIIRQRNISIFKWRAEITRTFPADAFVTHIVLKFQKAQTGLLLREYFIYRDNESCFHSFIFPL